MLEVGIQVRDTARAMRFYRDALGFVPLGEIDAGVRSISALAGGGAIVKLVRDAAPLDAANPVVSPSERAYGLFSLAVHVDNVESAIASCIAVGAELVTPFTSFPGGSTGGYAYVRDLDDNLIELIQGSPWSDKSGT